MANYYIKKEMYDSIKDKISQVEHLIHRGLESKCPFDPAIIDDALYSILHGIFDRTILKPILIGDYYVIDKVDGRKTIAKSQDIFKMGIDRNFTSVDIDKDSTPTDETPVALYEILNTVTFAQVYSFFETRHEDLTLTQNQIVNFCSKYPLCLRGDDNETFFLFKTEKIILIAAVRKSNTKGLSIQTNKMEYDVLLGGSNRYRLVIPKIEFKVPVL